MAQPSTHLRTNLYDVPLDARRARPIVDLLGLAAHPPELPAINAPGIRPHAPKRRIRIWELSSNLHCSIIGTCLSAPELRRLLVKLKVGGMETADEHELHMLGVLLAGRPLDGAKLLQKTLDRRHQLALSQSAKARDEAAVAALWERAFAGGDIAGAYWAVLTHPESSDKLVQKAFGDVHMMSHLMGATNCADLRRMRQLEQEVAALQEKLERQQKHLRDGFSERDSKIAQLTELLAETVRIEAGQLVGSNNTEVHALQTTVAELDKRLAREDNHRKRLEQRLAVLEQVDNARRDAERQRDALQRELDLVERQMAGITSEFDAAQINLAGMTILYVGGRAGQISQLKGLAEQAGAEFVHHDGGIEQAVGLLPGLVGRADVAFFPVDCVSHSAMIAVKRACQQLSRPYLALRTSSLTCLLSALVAMGDAAAPAAG